jgi:amidase
MIDRFLTVLTANTEHDKLALERLLGREVGPEDLESDNLFFAVLGAQVTAADYIAAITENHRWTRQMLEWWHPADGSAGFDLLLTPTLNAPPPPIGYLAGPEGGGRVQDLLQFTAQFNITGQPGISLPLHLSSDGLPVGVQLVAGHGREDVLIRVAAQIESAAPWAGRVPPVAAMR